MHLSSATIVITTRNRKEDLAKAIESCIQQTAKPEILVVDDGSTDGTSEMVSCEFPQVTLHREDVSKGYIVQRNFAARLAKAPILFSIDDDACFSTPHVVEETLKEFNNPAVGAIAIPFIDVCKDPAIVRQSAPSESGDFVIPSFIGTAHALRRDLFLRLGGYREQLFHQGEEGDYCLRMLDAGYVVKVGRSDVIHHYESPKRDFSRMDIYGRRNNLLFGWHNAPTAVLPLYLLGTTVNGLRHGLRVGRVGKMLSGLMQGYRDIPGEWTQRKPVARAIYSLHRKLVGSSVLPMDQVLEELSKHQLASKIE